MPEQMPHQGWNRIPEFSSHEEEAEFWDTHSLADYWSGFKPVQARFAKNLSDGVTVLLDQDALDKLLSLAKENGTEPSALARIWILERLKDARPPQRGNTQAT